MKLLKGPFVTQNGTTTMPSRTSTRLLSFYSILVTTLLIIQCELQNIWMISSAREYFVSCYNNNANKSKNDTTLSSTSATTSTATTASLSRIEKEQQQEEENDENILYDDESNKLIDINNTTTNSNQMIAVVHIGPHKTGTTTIQYEMKRLYDYLLLDHYELPHTNISDNASPNHFRLAHCLKDDVTYNHSDVRKYCDSDYVTSVVRIAARKSNLIISAERFATPEVLHDYMNTLLLPWYPNIYIIGYYRRFYDWMISWHNQIMKRRHVSRRDLITTWINNKHRLYDLFTSIYTYGSIKRYQKSFTTNHVKVYNVHDDHHNLVPDFFCNAIPYANNTCNYIQQELIINENKTAIKNSAVPLIYEDIAYHMIQKWKRQSQQQQQQQQQQRQRGIVVGQQRGRIPQQQQQQQFQQQSRMEQQQQKQRLPPPPRQIRRSLQQQQQNQNNDNIKHNNNHFEQQQHQHRRYLQQQAIEDKDSDDDNIILQQQQQQRVISPNDERKELLIQQQQQQLKQNNSNNNMNPNYIGPMIAKYDIKGLASIIQNQHEKIWNKKSYDFSKEYIICPTSDSIDYLYELSLLAEQTFVPVVTQENNNDNNQNNQQEQQQQQQQQTKEQQASQLRELIDTAAKEVNQLCYVDINKLLDNDIQWKAFYNNLLRPAV